VIGRGHGDASLVDPTVGECSGPTISVPSWTCTRSGEAAGQESGETAERTGSLCCEPTARP
jgi:hypothetical protein